MASTSQQINTMLKTYDWSGNKKCYIFDQREFDQSFQIQKRDPAAAERDYINMKDLFEGLGFEVFPYHNCTRENIAEVIVDDAKAIKDLEASVGIVYVVLSLGKKDFFLAKDGLFKIDWMWNAFAENDGLRNKPRFFIFQVEEYDLNLNDAEVEHDGPEDGKLKLCKELAPEVDLIYIFYRIASCDIADEDHCFSRIMKEVFTAETSKNKDILELMTVVNRKLTLTYKSKHTEKPAETTEDVNAAEFSAPLKASKCMVPCTVSHLRRRLVLK